VGPQGRVLSWEVPAIGAAPLLRLGLLVEAPSRFDGRIVVEEVDWRGPPRELTVSGTLLTSIWETQPPGLRGWVSSAENFEADSRYTFAISHGRALGLATTGCRDWDDYAVTSRLVFSLHSACGLVLRSVGHRRFYAALFEEGRRVTIVKQHYRARAVLASAEFPYAQEGSHRVEARCQAGHLTVAVDGTQVAAARDAEAPYPGGAAGFIVEGGTVYADGFCVRALAAGRQEPAPTPLRELRCR
jgi:hypothetical protein